MMSVTVYTSVVMVMACLASAGALTTYYVSMLGRDLNTIQAQVSPLRLIFFNLEPNNISVSITGSNCNGVGTFQIPERTTSAHEVTLNCTGLIPTGIEIAAKGLKVESSSNFILQVVQVDQSQTPDRLEGYLVLKSDQLGTEYYVSSYCVRNGTCQFSVLATADTSLNVRFKNGVTANTTCSSGTSASGSSTTSIPFSLGELDILHIESQQDLSGTYISSSAPIAVFAGARDIPTVLEGQRSHIIEQLIPTNKWARDFIVVPNDLNDNGDLINIVTKSDNTWVEILGLSPFLIPHAGDSVVRRIDWDMYTYIKTDKDVQMTQFMFIPLYDTNTTEAMPGMVLVPAINQWTTESYFYSKQSANPGAFLVSAATKNNTALKYKVDAGSDNDFFTAAAEVIERSDGGIAGHQNIAASITMAEIHGGLAGVYGFLEGNIATLGNIQLENNEECVVYYGKPGDGLDNDCDDQIDEDVCTLDDLVTTYYLPYDQSDLAAPIHTEVIEIGSTKSLYLDAITCGLLQIGLRSADEDGNFAAIQVSQTYIQLQVCTPNCDQSAELTVGNTVNDCTQDPISFKIEISSTSLIVESGDNTDQVNTANFEVDRLLVMPLVASANLSIDFTAKDCGKIISGVEDNYGTDFLVPTNQADYTLLITNRGTEDAKVTVKHRSSSDDYYVQVDPNESVTISNATNNHFLRLHSTSPDVSIHYLYKHSGGLSASIILPTDILGPHYFYYLDVANGDDKHFIASVSERGKVFMKDNQDSHFIDENDQQYNQNYKDSRWIEANTPLVFFSGQKSLGFAQLHPKEMLGTRFFIPAIDLDSLSAMGEITVITTEDSTYFTILGEYHNEYIKDYKGEVEVRSLYTNQIFEIHANKPVQVELQLKANNDGWGTLLTVPHIGQYVNTTVLPKLDGGLYEFKYSYGIDKNGNAVSGMTTNLPQSSSERTLTRAFEFFHLLVVKETASGKYFILQSDLWFNSRMNLVCGLTQGTGGDGVDNDCDNMKDEEECSADLEDPDLDGDVNEDCAANTNAPVNNAPLLALETNSTTCPTATPITTTTSAPTSEPPTPEPAVVIHHTLTKDWYSNLVYPPAPSPPTPPSFDPIDSTATTTTAAPVTGSTVSTSAGTTSGKSNGELLYWLAGVMDKSARGNLHDRLRVSMRMGDGEKLHTRRAKRGHPRNSRKIKSAKK